jgi:PAS domain S-box-containing protein
MLSLHISDQWRSFLLRIVLPTILTVVLYVLALFLIIIPTIEHNSLERKREMIRELTNAAWNILAKFEYDEQLGLVNQEQAQRQAIEQVRNLHYGEQMKNYFWINDMHPRMVIHPYRSDLDGSDLTGYSDPSGKLLFVDMVEVVRRNGAGYVEYLWQWQDDMTRIVPKISYVKGFAPWGWVIGTGIYIEDVREEIAQITSNIIQISLVIVGVVSVLLATIIVNTLHTERQRSLAEQALRESEEKYRTLVESSSEGMLMALDGKYMYANQMITSLLGYSAAELAGMPLHEIFSDEPQHPGTAYTRDLLAGKTVPEQSEARIITRSGEIKDVILAASQIEISGRRGFIIVITDITVRKQAEDALEASETKFRTLANNLNVGLYRRTAGSRPTFIEVNPAMVKLFGFESREELLACPVQDLYQNPEEMRRLGPIAESGALEREIVRLRRKDGTMFSGSIWAVAVRDEKGELQYFDGIVEDVSDLVARDEERERLLTEMQSALFFFGQAVGSLPLGDSVTCPADTSIREVSRLTAARNCDCAVVLRENRPAGIITNRDLCKLLAEERADLEQPAAQIMSAPLITADPATRVFKVGLLMEQHAISHVPVVDAHGTVTGIVTHAMITPLQKYSPALLLRRIQQASTPETIIAQRTTLSSLITSLIQSGARPEYVNNVSAVTAETLLSRLIELAIQQHGLPPVRFCFLVFGSEGRKEQTLQTDQDNAIVFEDVEPELFEDVQQYFLALADTVCGWLNDAGYRFCDGDNMAKNPEWCQPLAEWKRYFTRWISQGSAEDLLRTKIFFDFRSAWGEADFAAQLHKHLHTVIAQHPRFFQLLARNVLQLNPPIGVFGSFVVESKGRHGKVFDIKAAMLPMVDFARIYALQQNIEAANTLERLKQLHENNILSLQNHNEMTQAYTYLMQIRLRMQAAALSRGLPPDNYINPRSLSIIEQRLLKEIFSQIKNFQTRLSYDFTGQREGLS